MKDKIEEAEVVKYTEKDFIDAYDKLCSKMKFQISVNPIWKLRDDNTFSMVVETRIVEKEK